MPTFQIIAVLEVAREYEVDAINTEEAKRIVRQDHDYLPSTLIGTTVVDVMEAD